MTDLRSRLERLTPELGAEGQWERVLADARRPTRRALALVVPFTAAAAAVAIVALAWPFANKSPTVLELSLAALGDGPVIHVVTRADLGGSFVNLETGQVTAQPAESEVWYDPKRGLHEVRRFGGRVTSDRLIPPRHVAPQQAAQYVALVNRYRDALRSGKARVVAKGSVNGRPIVWIRLRGQWLPDVADGHYHLYAEEIAVDRDTYEPVYARSTRDGRPGPGLIGSGQLFLRVATLPAGKGDFDVDPKVSPRPTRYAGSELARHLKPVDLRRIFGRPAFWLGRTHRGKPLAEIREQLFKDKRRKDDPWHVVRGVSLFYGRLHPERFGIRLRDDRKPFVLLTEATKISPMWPAAFDGVDIPTGTVRIDVSGTGFLRSGGVYVSINAKELRDVVAAAFALRPFGAAPPRSRLDLGRVAREVERRSGLAITVTGGSRVRSRPFVKRGTKPAQMGSGDGVAVRIYRSGAAVFDTTRLSPSRRRMVHGVIFAGCAKITGPSGSVGGSATPFRRRITILMLGPVAPPFDLCELGLGQGRNALPRFNWHGPVEIPLTERGRRFVEERAAARELSTFARIGPMQRAREAMKGGAPAPPAAGLADPTGRIGVVSRGDRIVLTLNAATGRRFFIEIVRGRIARQNTGGFARTR